MRLKMKSNVSLTVSVILALLVSNSEAGVIKERRHIWKARVKRNSVATDPNNIRVTVGLVQTHPPLAPVLPESEFEMEESESDDEPDGFPENDFSLLDHITPETAEVFDLDDLHVNENVAVSPVNVIVDMGNESGEHQNNVIIGGIQNFSRRTTEDIMKALRVDANNRGGIHRNSVTIGGMLIF